MVCTYIFDILFSPIFKAQNQGAANTVRTVGAGLPSLRSCLLRPQTMGWSLTLIVPPGQVPAKLRGQSHLPCKL